MSSNSTSVYQSMYSTAAHTGATLKTASVRTRRLGILTYACPTCGTYDVYVGTTRLARLSAVRSTAGWTTLWVPRQSTEHRGTLMIRTTNSHKVAIDGVVIRHL